MNKSNFIQTGGYPLKGERLQELQTAYSIFNSLGALAGNLTIISGCALVGSTVGDGFVYIDGELLEFKSAAVTGTSTVIIIETPVNRAFENGTVKQVHAIRYATFGTAATSWLWTDFKRPIETKAIPTDLVARLEALEKKNAVFQTGGGMMFWNKPAVDIPPGWAEVVDWRGRMPVGFDATQTEFNAMGKTGGNKLFSLLKTHLPNIRIKVYPSGNRFGENDTTQVGFFSSSGDSSNGSSGYTETEPLGDGTALNILNPYRVVLFIEFIG